MGPLGGATRSVAGWLSAGASPPPSDRVIALSRAPSPAPIPGVPPVTSPSGATLSLDSLSLRLNGSPILPVAGEFHPSRVPASRWREDLLKMRAGGLTIVSAYVMWLHTEEVRGAQDFSGNRNVSAFLDAAWDAGLMVALRIGPWDHGECRNGGLPDWVLAACTGGCRLRANETAWMGLVEGWYAGLAAHVRGRGWAEGGPVISIQVDNETPDARYLLALRQLAAGLGMRPAFWVKTGWPSPSSPVPYGALVPLFGGYVDQFWGSPTDVSYGNFLFADAPNPAPLPPAAGAAPSAAAATAQPYPWLMVEMGGGMASSYHRRVHVDGEDHTAQAAVFLGSGAANLGFYMCGAACARARAPLLTPRPPLPPRPPSLTPLTPLRAKGITAGQTPLASCPLCRSRS